MRMVDPLLACSEAEPVWRADPKLGGTSGDEALFRRVLPVPGWPHPNLGSLSKVKARLVGSSVFFALPSAVALYDRNEVAKPHAQHCSTRYCVIPAAVYFVNEAGVAFPSSKVMVTPARPGHGGALAGPAPRRRPPHDSRSR